VDAADHNTKHATVKFNINNYSTVTKFWPEKLTNKNSSQLVSLPIT
jgi:hypothetical protein